MMWLAGFVAVNGAVWGFLAYAAARDARVEREILRRARRRP